MSVFREENPYDGSIINRGMTVEDWRRLHSRVMPNPLSMEEFKAALTAGKAQDAYLAKDLHKIMQELRDILKEHGELREAAGFPLTGRKAELGKAAAAAVRLIDGGSGDGQPEAAAGPLPHRRTGGGGTGSPTSPRGTTVAGPEDLGRSPDSLGIPCSPEDGRRAPHPSLQATPGKGTRAPPFTDHIEEGRASTGDAVDPLTTSTVPPRTVGAGTPSGKEGGSRSRPNYNRTWQMNAELSRTVAQNASRERSPQGDTASPAHATAVAEKVQHILSSSSALQPSSSPMSGLLTHSTGVGLSTGVKNELAVLNEHSPPFFQILNVVRRFQLRYGSHPLKFEIPIQYAQAVATRRVRLHVIPFRHPNVPSRWPVAKEIVVYVNDQCVTTPWRRSWPERKEEVAKTYLPLDVTQLLNRSHPQQRIQIDVFNKDYFTPALLAVVQPFTLEEVVESILERELGESQLAKIQCRLRSDAPSPSPAPSRLADNDAAMARFYQRVMEDDVDEGLEVDDPIITTKCPISQMPIEIPVRGRQCGHLQCVDLASYLVSCHKGSYWNCALCDRELRPTALTIDTVLWRYLLRAAAGTPHHLRLSVRGGDAMHDGVAGVHCSAKHFWHRSRGLNGEADVLVDDDEEGRSDGLEGETEEAVAKREQQQQQYPPTAPKGWPVNEGSSLPGAESGVKRPRESSEWVLEGSFENPIEL